MPHPSISDLLRMADAANPPGVVEAGAFDARGFTVAGGWTVWVLYDCGALDCIDHFTSPDGEEIDFWRWPEGLPGRDLLLAWRGKQDTNRLLALANYPHPALSTSQDTRQPPRAALRRRTVRPPRPPAVSTDGEF